jgi:hypothetical protein
MFRPYRRRLSEVAVVALLTPGAAHAGVTTPAFSDIAQARMQVLSFFLVLYLPGYKIDTDDPETIVAASPRPVESAKGWKRTSDRSS